MTAQNPPIFLQAGSHPAEDVRRELHSRLLLPRNSIVGSGDLAVTQNGTPNMSVIVAGGRAYIIGTEATYQGLYHVENRGTQNLAIAAADATNPRRDLVVAKVQDAAYSGGTNAWSLAVVTGVPAASPVDPAAPANSMVLARVSVAAGATSITNANITDLRVSGTQGRLALAGGVLPCTSTTRPTTGLFTGLRIFEEDTLREYIYNGTTWVSMGGAGAWESYTAVWKLGTNAITLGNGSSEGRFMRIGKTVHYWAKLSVGTTTAFPANNTMNVNAPLSVRDSTSMRPVGSWGGNTGAWASGVAVIAVAVNQIAFEYTNNGGLIDATTPLPFSPPAAGKSLMVQGTYETDAA